MIDWKPIEDLKAGSTCVLLIAQNSPKCPNYTTDPYCGWLNIDGSFTRWPHSFPPTHFAEINKP